MSRSSSFDIRYSSSTVSAYEILMILLDYGWDLNDFGDITFLPLGDTDSFEWTSKPFTEEGKTDVFNILRTKEQMKEILGIILQWKDTQIGGSVLIYPDQTLSFSASINRLQLSDITEVTDVNWYIDKLLTPLAEKNVIVESIEWSEFV